MRHAARDDGQPCGKACSGRIILSQKPVIVFAQTDENVLSNVLDITLCAHDTAHRPQYKTCKPPNKHRPNERIAARQAS